MFTQTKVLYVIGEEAGNSNVIINSLNRHSILEYFFKKEVEVENKSFIRFICSLPRNTVFCSNINHSFEGVNSVSIAIPFLSSHVNFPVKVGENVWFYKYDKQDQNLPQIDSYSIDGYYLGRVHSLLNTEDTSYCFSERESTIYNLDNYDNEDELSDTKQGVLEAVEAHEQFFVDQETIMHKPAIESYSNVSNQVLNTGYYKNILEDYKLGAYDKKSNAIEDLSLTGTYNSSIRLTSVSLSKENSTSNIETEPKKAKIEIIAGENEKLKALSFETTKPVKVVDNTGFIDEEGTVISTYKNNISPEVFNGYFTETIKTPRIFVNSMLEDENLKNGINKQSNKGFINNSSSLIVSESNEEFLSIKNEIRFSIPPVGDSFDQKVNSANVLSNKQFITNLPEINAEQSSSMGDPLYSSSISAISDDISISLHNKNFGDILLSAPNSSDGRHNYLKISNTGNLHIDAQKIVIGEASRTPSSHGTNAGLYLGFSNEMQSLVLGEQLKAFIEEILSVQKETLNLTKELFIMSKDMDDLIKTNLNNTNSKLKVTNNVIKEFAGAINDATQSGPVAPLNPPFKAFFEKMNNNEEEIIKNEEEIKKIPVNDYQTQINNFKALGKKENSNSELLYSRLEKIEKSLDKILSKFVKTTWLSHYLYIYNIKKYMLSFIDVKSKV